ncbi:Flagellar hook-associated protein 1 FlgK [Pseudomonas sp. 8AS]|uniref:flagellar hook-associated protein FlgK n=1 Tax=Pseudomonas sp. 8AS TaxID=2653163 RepID=UPI0012F11E2F|nr:flagellar hook-associated protein FlgK [Pseudomonas sp. 8AS]VXB91033.1 Flagellar hook-associated protein 1 FlgK [Pseudomonas sp. 8AS]
MADLLNIGLSGLAANKTSLAVTGHNISNVNTPGFSRQDTVQATRIPQFSGAGYIGSGTTLTDVRRSYSEFLTAQLRSSTALSGDVEAYKSQIDQLDALLAGSTTGITPTLQKFFSSLQTAAEDPANIPARQLVLSEAEGLARRFNTVYDRLADQNEFINKQMVAVTDQINRLASGIGQLNEAIAVAAANGNAPNDLLDAREESIRQLSEYIGVTVVSQDDNTFNLFVGSGQPLVVGSQVNRLEAVPGTSDPTRFEVQFVSGNSRQNVTTQLVGGELGGLIRYRGEALDATLNSLGRLALALNSEVNEQLGQGLDLKGQVGTALFGDFNDPQLADLRVRPYADNISNADAALTITDTRLLTASDYRLEFNGTSYSARRLSDGASIGVTTSPLATDPTLPGSYPLTLNFTYTDAQGDLIDQGFNITLDSLPAAGDRFMLEPTRRGATDIETVLDQPDQLAFAAPAKAEATLNNRGTGVIGQPGLTNALGPIPSPISIAALDGAAGFFGSNGLTLTFDATTNQLSIAGSGSGADFVPAGPITIVPGQQNTLRVSDGTYTFDFTLSGVPQNGDTFTLDFNQNGVSDNRNALKLVDLQSAQIVGVDPSVSTIPTGTSLTDGYGDLVERVGTLTAQTRLDSEATGAILKQATDNRDSLSAVNLDEEAANLIKFEQYYQASAQIIQVARSLFDTLINTF